MILKKNIIFYRCDKSENTHKILNLEQKKSFSASDSEIDDDIKFIMDKNNKFFEKIDTILIDLTKDEVSESINNPKNFLKASKPGK